MKDEISAAVVFIAKIVRKSKHLNTEDVSVFSDKLAQVLVSRFRNHWYEDHPSKGQGYRCIRISIDEPRDSALEKAAEASGIDYSVLNLPAEMTLWIDPREVTCRFGERGTCCTIARFNATDGSDEDVVDDNGNPNHIRIPSPSLLIEQSQQGDKLRNGNKVLRNNFRNDIYYNSQYPYYSPGARPPPRWGNHGAVTVRS